MTTSDALQLATQFHEVYERLAPSFGYETRKETRQFDPTTPNGRLMVAVCAELIAARTSDDKTSPAEGVMVPREPTEAMVNCLRALQSSDGAPMPKQAYVAMLAARPASSPASNAEPVAWRIRLKGDGDDAWWIGAKLPDDTSAFDVQPLYAAPQPVQASPAPQSGQFYGDDLERGYDNLVATVKEGKWSKAGAMRQMLDTLGARPPAYPQSDERAEFERAYRSNYLGSELKLDQDGMYTTDHANAAWWAWQARAALTTQSDKGE